MLIRNKPQIVESRGTVCEFHKLHPGEQYPGCTCTAVYWTRDKTWDEMTDEEKLAETDPWAGFATK